MRACVSLFSLCACLTAVGCARDVIPNTDVEDTAETREVVEFVEEYRKALAARDSSKLLSLASDDYYDDLGTPSGTDDVDKKGLGERLDQAFSDELLDVHYDIRYHDVIFKSSKVLVDITYIGRFQIITPEGPRWERRLNSNRLVLAREGDVYRILSGM